MNNTIIGKIIREGQELQKEHPNWDRLKYSRESKLFDINYAEIRNKYLETVTHLEAFSLTTEDAYDRLVLLRRKEYESDLSDVTVSNVKAIVYSDKNAVKYDSSNKSHNNFSNPPKRQKSLSYKSWYD